MPHLPFTKTRRSPSLSHLPLAVPRPREDDGPPTSHALITAATAHEEAAAVLAERDPDAAERHRAVAQLLRDAAQVAPTTLRLPN